MTEPDFYGPVDVERHREFVRHGVHLHVFYNGEDVTTRCYFADDRPGRQVANLYRVDVNNRQFYKEDLDDCGITAFGAATETVEGDIQIRPGEPF